MLNIPQLSENRFCYHGFKIENVYRYTESKLVSHWVCHTQPPADIDDLTLAAAADKYREGLTTEIPQATKTAALWVERAARVADQERRTHICLEVCKTLSRKMVEGLEQP